jgi:small subunit ribosomal protein S2
MIRSLCASGAFLIMKETDAKGLIERMFKAGAHFGFSKSRRHPSVAPYLFGTKEEIAVLVRTEAARVNVPFVANRWVGGIITNFSEIKKRMEYLLRLRSERETGELERKYTKKERLMLSREIERLENNFNSILGIERTPDILLVVDPRHESIAVAEARQSGIPVVAIMSSDCNTDLVEKPVVVNDANRGSVALALAELVDAYAEGRAAQQAKREVARTQK